MEIEIFKNIDIDENISFFCSFIEHYPGFREWKDAHGEDQVYCTKDDKGKVTSLLKFKVEDESEAYDFSCEMKPMRRLKISTLKVDTGHHKWNIDILKDYMTIVTITAYVMKCDEIYVTMFTDNAKLRSLKSYLTSVGFKVIGSKSNGEKVLMKKSEFILMPIKPKFVEQIRNGNKAYEFRKNMPKREVRGMKMLIYESAPVKKIVAMADITDIVNDSLSCVWDKTKKEAGISKSEFYTYYGESEKAVAYQLSNILFFDEPVALKEIDMKTAPQSYAYVASEMLRNTDKIKNNFRYQDGV